MSHPDDSDQDPGWNSDDEKDYADQHAAPPSLMAHYTGLQDPLARFLSTVQDWSVLDKVALDNAIKGAVGPAPPGISLHDAIKVKLHDYLLYDVVHDIYINRSCFGCIMTHLCLYRPVCTRVSSRRQ